MKSPQVLFKVLLCLQGFWECEGDGEPEQLTGPPLGPPAHARDVQGCHQCRLMGGLEEKKSMLLGKKRNLSSSCTSWIRAVPKAGSNF